MPIFQGFFLENNNDKKTEVSISRIDQKVNSKGDVKQKLPLSHTSQKINTRAEKHPAFRANKSQKIIIKYRLSFIASMNNTENDISVEPMNIIRE